ASIHYFYFHQCCWKFEELDTTMAISKKSEADKKGGNWTADEGKVSEIELASNFLPLTALQYRAGRRVL
ncbi:hypothetical protein J6590_091581, partial [Homalodisca vitripennis]